MASVNPQPLSRTYSSLQQLPQALDNSETNWALRLNIWQVALVWGIIGGLMCAVYVFGLHSGKKQGIKQALDEQSNQVVRLPVEQIVPARIISGSENTLEVAALLPKDSAQDSKTLVDRANTELDKLKTIEGLNREVGVEKPKALNGSESPGFLLKGADEAIASSFKAEARTVAATEAGNFNKKNLVTSNVEPKDTKLAPSPQLAKKASAPPAKIPPEGVMANKPLSRGWYIQVAATKTPDEANAVLGGLKTHGIQSVLQNTKLGNASYSRILAGPYSGRAEALVQRKKISSLGISRGEPFLKQVSE